MKLLASTSRGSEAPWLRAAEACGWEILAKYAPTVEDFEGCDGLILCGGGDVEPRRYGEDHPEIEFDCVRDAAEYALLDEAAAKGKKVLGVCRGCQVLGAYFGGTLVPDLPVSPIDHRHTGTRDAYHAIIAEEGDLCRELYGERFLANSSHHQAIREAGELIVTARAEDGTVEGVKHPSLPIAGVQWHPERCGRDCPDEIKPVDGMRFLKAYFT